MFSAFGTGGMVIGVIVDVIAAVDVIVVVDVDAGDVIVVAAIVVIS